jgi:hypothetical protein
MPPDYLQRGHRKPLRWRDGGSFARALGRVVRNVFAYAMVAVAIPLVVPPGPGITLLFVGVLLADFPGKRRAIHWLLTHGAVHKTINWFRGRAGREPLVVPFERQ